MAELAVIVPTFNEKANVLPLIEAVDRALAGIEYEIVFVDDDSLDGTSEHVRAVAQANPRVRILQRINRKGLASAVIEGMMSTSAPYLAVIDGDMQHDERVLPQMLAKLKQQQLDIVVGSRHVEGGGMGDFSKSRVLLSNAGKALSRSISKTPVSDPMSGFFLLDRRFLDDVVRELSSTGFKILLDLLASARRPVKLGEVGYTFRLRERGESKLNIIVSLEYLRLLLDKWVGAYVPVTYLIFGVVGAFGVLVNLAIIFLLLRFGIEFSQAFIWSSSLVIAVNFFLNNALTFRSRRLQGAGLIVGLVLFYLACLIGLVVNLGIANSLREKGFPLWLSGLTGVTLSSVWNYWVTSILVWRAHRRGLRRPALPA
ncbi:glycosyltransferase [Paludibaculum fermentans]|uniref:Glycosyltransferase family 2 protein n=1 Tax=Paludibaculum fermentans TaxID=1473598 RepID=A0A7S7NTX6_PALFE|nr:glycosyltransferase family 2 protein [Paludibaculum fermentans]QOY89750.1 glycosyltransferase family 2 protein [Paludibaculum fermentans]